MVTLCRIVTSSPIAAKASTTMASRDPETPMSRSAPMDAHLQRVGGFALQQQREMPPRSIPLFSDADARLAHRPEAELFEATLIKTVPA
jgi:hypothetical protein